MTTKGDRARARLLDAVARALVADGYGRMSIAAGARDAGLPRSGFYFYFASRGEAVAAVTRGLFEDFAEVATPWYDHEVGRHRETFSAAMAATVALWRSRPALLLGLVQAAATDDVARSIWDDWVGSFVARAVPTIQRTMTASAPPGVTAEGLACRLVGLTFAAMQDDVAALVAGREVSGSVAEELAFVWLRTLYEDA